MAANRRTGRRAQLAPQVTELRAQGLTYRQIGERLGISRSYAAGVVNDPDLVKQNRRRDSYRGRCGCGRPTDGSRGRTLAPTTCLACLRGQPAAVREDEDTRLVTLADIPMQERAEAAWEACRTVHTAGERLLILHAALWPTTTHRVAA